MELKTGKETTGGIFILIRRNLSALIFICASCLVVAGIYAAKASDIYKAVTSLKVNKSRSNILQAPLLSEFQEFGSDRFIANEIQILRSHTIAERVVKALFDSASNYSKDSFYLIIDRDFLDSGKPRFFTVPEMIELLQDNIFIEQRKGHDIIEISMQSASSFEAAMISNCFAEEYAKLNLEINRNELTTLKNFLHSQKKSVREQLNGAEASLRKFQENEGIISVDLQVSEFINKITSLESRKNVLEIELSSALKNLSVLKNELEKQSPELENYLASIASEIYFRSLQEELARLEINRDLARAGSYNPNTDQTLLEYGRKIEQLNLKLNNKIGVIKAGILASSPEQIKELSKKILDEEIKCSALDISLSQVKKLYDYYEKRFTKLPSEVIEIARYQRNKEALEKLYIVLDEKYQEALINEQSQPGNVYIIDRAERTDTPYRPNRFLIMIIGLIMGSGFSMGYIYVKNYFDTTIKTPEDIKDKNITLLAWVPQIEGNKINNNPGYDFIVSQKPDSIAGEAFKSLRTRIRYSKIKSSRLTTLLITSPLPREGKTTISVNLAGSFAQSKCRTLILDTDLRKPRMHSIFGYQKTPGLVDYLLGYASLDEIIHMTGENNLDFISSGTIPTNPAEVLDSAETSEFLRIMKKVYDIIIIDSAPLVPVTDTEIIAKKVDASLLVVSAETTEADIMSRSIELLNNETSTFIGAILNNFSYKAGYASYYKYYYYYNSPFIKKETC